MSTIQHVDVNRTLENLKDKVSESNAEAINYFYNLLREERVRYWREMLWELEELEEELDL